MDNINEPVFKIDGEVIDTELIDKFKLRDFSRNLRFSYAKNAEVINFVGFVIQDDEMLVALPKHYAKVESSFNQSDIELLFGVMWRDQTRNSQRYVGPVKEFGSSFPFEAFYSIYRYYQRYGLYQDIETITKPGYNGIISWKDTIRKGANIVSEGNLVYLPLFIQKTQDKQVFLSECMAFAIWYTLSTYPYFIRGKVPIGSFSNFDFWGNREYVVDRLRKIQSEVFKDLHKRLVRNLINFFSNVLNGGNVSIKHYNFELVWESMVEEYLNDFFVGADEDGLRFSIDINEAFFKFKKVRFNVDKINPNHRLEPDHYYCDENVQFIFDAKYYSTIDGLNHKQLAYHTVLKKMSKETYNALLLPSDGLNKQRKHFELKKEYYLHLDDQVKVWEYYLNMKLVMENYLK